MNALLSSHVAIALAKGISYIKRRGVCREILYQKGIKIDLRKVHI